MPKFTFELEVEPRELHGKGASRRLRSRENKIPAIIYGAEEQPQSVALHHHHVEKALKNEAVFSHVLTLVQSGKKQRVVLKDIQRHPYKPRILHIDFLRVSENKPITMHVPLHFPGQEKAPGVVLQGGMVTHHMVELEVRCLPSDLPEYIEIDLTDAPLDTVIHLSQVKLPKAVELVSVIHGPEDDLPIVSIHMPKRIEEEEVSASEEESSAEGEAPKEDEADKE